jgi:biotin/methionine sulfoxide reductase
MRHLIGTHFGTYEVGTDETGAPRLQPFEGDPAPSPIGPGLLELAGHPLRVRQPMARLGWIEGSSGGAGRGKEPFVPLSWDDALDRLAREVERVRSQFGNPSIFAGSYGWASAGRFHHAQSQLKRALNLLGGFTTSVNTYSYGTAGVLLPHVLGASQRDACDTAPYWDEIASQCRLLLAFGGFRATNSQVESGGSGRHDVRRWLDRTAANGCRIIVVSPSRADIPPGLRAEYVPIRPNTDTALLLALAYELRAASLADDGFIARCCVGFDKFAAYLDRQKPSAEWAAGVTGIPAASIREIARALHATRSTVSLSWSLQRARFGEQPYWAAIALAAMTGQIGTPGGGIAFGLGSVGSVGNPVVRAAGPALPQGANPVRHYIPVGRIADLLLNPGGTLDYDGLKLPLPDIRMVWWSGGNPYHHHQDLNHFDRAWQRPETIVVQDPFWTSTARRADLVLPSALPTERNDIAASSRDNWIVANRAVSRPPAGVLTDHEAQARLLERFGLREAFTEGRDEMAWIRHLYEGYRARHGELPSFERFWEEGAVMLPGRPPEADERHRIRRFVADPAAAPLDTPSGKIEIGSARIAGFGYPDCPGHPAWLAPEEWLGSPVAERYPLHLLSPQPEGKLHSQLDAAGNSMRTKTANRERIHLNPRDCSDRGIAAGDLVRAFNDRGATLAVAEPDAGVIAGVAILATGSWLDIDPATGLEVHGNPNVLTPDVGSSRLSQGPAPNSCLIEVERWTKAAPPVTVHNPPSIVTSPDRPA